MDLTLESRVVKGFRFAGVAAGLRKEPGRQDLGVIVADRPVAAAGVFTTNRVKAAPVVVTQERIEYVQSAAIPSTCPEAVTWGAAHAVEIGRRWEGQ